LDTLFSNLIENSIQHGGCEKIRITCKDKKEDLVVSVEDYGKGIPDKMKDNIFDRGFKKGENAGTGLGLYMIKEIAKSYDGSVEVKDSDMGGARFDIKLKKFSQG